MLRGEKSRISNVAMVSIQTFETSQRLRYVGAKYIIQFTFNTVSTDRMHVILEVWTFRTEEKQSSLYVNTSTFSVARY